MTPDDLIHAAPAITKSAAAIGAAIPFTTIVKRTLGPAVAMGDEGFPVRSGRA